MEPILYILIAQVRAALDRWGKGDIEGPLELYASDFTYFDPYAGKTRRRHRRNPENLRTVRREDQHSAVYRTEARPGIPGAWIHRQESVPALRSPGTADSQPMPGGGPGTAP